MIAVDCYDHLHILQQLPQWWVGSEPHQRHQIKGF